MQSLVLLGAGFTKNWGGWVAKEAFEYLLGHPNVDDDIRGILVQHDKDGGGFEAALAELRADAAANPSGPGMARAQALDQALREMFRDMHLGLFKKTDARLGNEVFSKLLARFDGIFTLNQDLFLEMHYVKDYVGPAGVRKWVDRCWPGFRRSTQTNAVENAPLFEPEMPWLVAPDQQPIFKLHGSSNLVTSTGEIIMVMGKDSHSLGPDP